MLELASRRVHLAGLTMVERASGGRRPGRAPSSIYKPKRIRVSGTGKGGHDGVHPRARSDAAFSSRGGSTVACMPIDWLSRARNRAFSAAGWEAALARTVKRAFAEIPLYREQWAEAGRVLTMPQ